MLRLMFVAGSAGAGQFTGFLKRLVRGATSPVFLIVDGHPPHESGVLGKMAQADRGTMKATATAHPGRLQRRPHMVPSYPQKETSRHAA